MTTDNYGFYLQNGLIQTSQTGGQWYSDTSPFSIPWLTTLRNSLLRKKCCRRDPGKVKNKKKYPELSGTKCDVFNFLMQAALAKWIKYRSS
jgi:hypothetical protein